MYQVYSGYCVIGSFFQEFVFGGGGGLGGERYVYKVNNYKVM